MSSSRKPYTGSARTLVVALDVGTTFSGVSYAILEPGEVPKIYGVTRYPGQEHVAGNSKIPSILYYDGVGKVMAAGAEAETSKVISQAEDEHWQKVELFKLRLRPKAMKLDMKGMKLSPLPPNKTALDVYGDFLHYLLLCTSTFIKDTHANGPALWKSVENSINFVLSHPNGWEGAQQSAMRQSAINGGLIPDTDEGKARIRFVTEGEASLHACVLNGLGIDGLSRDKENGFIVVDAGGGTLDISSYAIRRTSPLIIEEIAPADCIFAGSVFVSRRARAFLEEKLKGSKYGTPEALDHITKRFDETTKRLFRDKGDPQFIPFGSPLDKDSNVGIRNGQLKLTGNEVASLFEPSIDAAVNSIRAQLRASIGAIKAVWLVGGFAANHYLFTELQKRLASDQLTINRPDTQTSKAVADGAVGFFCDHHVSARMSKFSYGVEFLRELDPSDEEHSIRKDRMTQLPSGPHLFHEAFDCILEKNVRVKENSVFSRKYYTEVTQVSTLSLFEIEIWCYRGGDQVPKWIDKKSEHFGRLCFVQADLSKLSSIAQPKNGTKGQIYWTVTFSIEIHFGLTEFKARIKWIDEGETRYGPATIIYDEQGHRPYYGTASISVDGSETARTSSSSRSGTKHSMERDSSNSISSRKTNTERASRESKTNLSGGNAAISAPAMSERSSTSRHKDQTAKSVSSSKQQKSGNISNEAPAVAPLSPKTAEELNASKSGEATTEPKNETQSSNITVAATMSPLSLSEPSNVLQSTATLTNETSKVASDFPSTETKGAPKTPYTSIPATSSSPQTPQISPDHPTTHSGAVVAPAVTDLLASVTSVIISAEKTSTPSTGETQKHAAIEQSQVALTNTLAPPGIGTSLLNHVNPAPASPATQVQTSSLPKVEIETTKQETGTPLSTSGNESDAKAVKDESTNAVEKKADALKEVSAVTSLSTTVPTANDSTTNVKSETSSESVATATQQVPPNKVAGNSTNNGVNVPEDHKETNTSSKDVIKEHTAGSANTSNSDAEKDAQKSSSKPPVTPVKDIIGLPSTTSEVQQATQTDATANKPVDDKTSVSSANQSDKAPDGKDKPVSEATNGTSSSNILSPAPASVTSNASTAPEATAPSTTGARGAEGSSSTAVSDLAVKVENGGPAHLQKTATSAASDAISTDAKSISGASEKTSSTKKQKQSQNEGKKSKQKQKEEQKAKDGGASTTTSLKEESDLKGDGEEGNMLFGMD